MSLTENGMSTNYHLLILGGLITEITWKGSEKIPIALEAIVQHVKLESICCFWTAISNDDKCICLRTYHFLLLIIFL